jgi:hypothetical protein
MATIPDQSSLNVLSRHPPRDTDAIPFRSIGQQSGNDVYNMSKWGIIEREADESISASIRTH